MANRFFTNILNLLGGQKARAADVEADFDAVSVGFDKVQTELDALVTVDGGKAPKDSPSFTGPATFAGPVTVPDVSPTDSSNLAAPAKMVQQAIAKASIYVPWNPRVSAIDTTAVRQEMVGMDTSGGPRTLTLPAAPSPGDKVGFYDYGRSFHLNPLALQPAAGQAIEDGTVGEICYVRGRYARGFLLWTGTYWKAM